jgi:hypothetical protein
MREFKTIAILLDYMMFIEIFKKMGTDVFMCLASGQNFLKSVSISKPQPVPGCASGCEARVIYGLLMLFNTLHSRCVRQELFDKHTVLALCRNNSGYRMTPIAKTSPNLE